MKTKKILISASMVFVAVLINANQVQAQIQNGWADDPSMFMPPNCTTPASNINNTIVRDGKVGIGWEFCPTTLQIVESMLHVKGDIRTSTEGRLILGDSPNGNAGNEWIQNTYTTLKPWNKGLGFYTNGQERMRIKHNGNVGINTDGPAAYLDVGVNAGIGHVWVGRSDQAAVTFDKNSSASHFHINYGDYFQISEGGTPGDVPTMSFDNGRVAIGDNPNFIFSTYFNDKLHVEGGNIFVGNHSATYSENYRGRNDDGTARAVISGNSTNNHSPAEIILCDEDGVDGASSNPANTKAWTIRHNSTNQFQIENYSKNSQGDDVYKRPLQIELGAPDNSFLMKTDGKIAMGTDKTPSTLTGGADVSNYNLYVAGGILTEELRCATDWADYVFDKDYDLKPLSKVEQFIAENGHLPNTPSGKEIEANGGIEVGEITVNQQEKIEELFLYVIELEKKIKNLEKEVKK